MKGTTKSGFNYQLKKEDLDDYEVVELVANIEDEPLLIVKLMNKLLGKEQKNALMAHCRNEKGRVPIKAMTEEITEIFKQGQTTKNSSPLPECKKSTKKH